MIALYGYFSTWPSILSQGQLEPTLSHWLTDTKLLTLKMPRINMGLADLGLGRVLQPGARLGRNKSGKHLIG